MLNPKLSFPVTPQVLERVQTAEREAVAEIERAFALDGDDICAILIETIQGEGGDNHFRAEFLRELRRLADENEALLIFDEVQTGLAMTGKMWAYENYGVTPMRSLSARRCRWAAPASAACRRGGEPCLRDAVAAQSTWGG